MHPNIIAESPVTDVFDYKLIKDSLVLLAIVLGTVPGIDELRKCVVSADSGVQNC